MRAPRGATMGLADNAADAPERPELAAPDSAILSVRDLVVHFAVRRAWPWSRAEYVHAVDGVSFSVDAGETLALVGETGSGKSTIANAILRLCDVTSGSITFEGVELTSVRSAVLRPLRQHMQAVFQEPSMSLNPHMTVAQIIAEPMIVHGLARNVAEARPHVETLLGLCKMPVDAAARHPHSFSGGQQQRIALARALSVRPKLVVADEPTSSLDVSSQAQIVTVMVDMQERLGLSYLLISHALPLVREMAHRVAVLYAGRIVELGPAERVFANPKSPYTQALLSASPVPDPEIERRRARIVLRGEPPDPIRPPKGCRFHTRCPMAEDVCRIEEPPLEEKESEHWAACWLT